MILFLYLGLNSCILSFTIKAPWLSVDVSCCCSTSCSCSSHSPTLYKTFVLTSPPTSRQNEGFSLFKTVTYYPVAFGVNHSMCRASTHTYAIFPTAVEVSEVPLPLAIFGSASVERALRKAFRRTQMSFCLSIVYDKKNLQTSRCHRSWLHHVQRGKQRPVAETRALIHRKSDTRSSKKHFTLENCQETQVIYIFLNIIKQHEKLPLWFRIIKAKTCSSFTDSSFHYY